MDFSAIRPDNPAYTQFTDMIEKASRMEWTRIEHDDNEIDVTMKGIVVARFIPIEDGFKVLYPSGPGYRFPMESSGDDRDGLTRQVVITEDSDTYEAMASIGVAHRWADSMVSDEEWMDF